MTWTATFGTRQCKVCSADFTARQHNAKYCSMGCYQKRYKFQPKQALLTSVEERIKEAYRRGYNDNARDCYCWQYLPDNVVSHKHLLDDGESHAIRPDIKELGE